MSDLDGDPADGVYAHCASTAEAVSAWSQDSRGRAVLSQRRSDPAPTLLLDVPALLQAQVREVHLEIDGHMKAWASALPEGATTRGSPALALYLHGATVEDVAIHTLLLKQAPLFSTTWSGTGQARYAPTDLEPIRRYVEEVYAATDAYLAGLTVDAVSRRVDLARLRLGQPSVAWVVSHFVILELAHLGGELVNAAHLSGPMDHPCSDMYRT